MKKYYSSKVRPRLVRAVLDYYYQNCKTPPANSRLIIKRWARYIHPEGKYIMGEALTPYQKQCKKELEEFLGLRCQRIRRPCPVENARVV